MSEGNSYIIKSSEESEMIQLSGIKNQVWSLGVTVLPGTVVFMILSLSNYVLDFRATMKKRVVDRHMGYSFLDMYKEVACRTAVTNLVPVSFLLIKGGMSFFLAIVLLAIWDMLCWIYIYYSMRRKSKTLNEINPLMNLG